MLPAVSEFCRLVLICVPELVADGIAVGAGAAELSRRGVARVGVLRERMQSLTPDVIVAADVAQAIAVGRALGEPFGLEPTVETRLRDQHLGSWEGRAWDEIAAAEPDAVRDFFQSFAERVPGEDGESLGAAVERVLAWWHEVAPEAAGKVVVAVSASNVLAGFVAAMLGMRLSRSLSLRLPPGGIGVLDVYGNGARVTAWNADAIVGR